MIKADRLTEHLTKLDLFSILEFKGFTQELEMDPEIHPADLLAEYSRNLDKKSKGKVQKPAVITAMNLMKHEYPGDDCYDYEAWKALPSNVRKEIGYEKFASRSISIGLELLGITSND